VKHYIIYAVLCLIILLQWFIINDSSPNSEIEAWKYILREVLVDRADWCARQGFNKVR
jgi:hypothetical protein